VNEPHSRAELLRILDTLKEAGVEAWWYSVSAKGSFPLYPSRVLPFRKEVVSHDYPWLVEQAHQRDIVLYSWEYLNTAPLLMAEHPDWRVKYLQGPERVIAHKPRHDHFACFNSPYGQLLKDFCVEVVNDIGFDGIWFDGCYLFGPADDGFRWTCCCEYCAKKFKEDSGAIIPQHIDWADPVFHAFVNWRYRTFMAYWQELAEYVRQRNATAQIVFNFFNRLYMGAVSGSPLLHHPMDALIASEGTVKTVQMQIKTLRAVNENFPPEVWTNLHDGVKLSYPSRPNPDPTSSIFYAQAAATAGGYASFGVSVNPDECAQSLRDLSEALTPLKNHVGGQPLKHCALLYSSMTKDFTHQPVDGAPHFATKNKPVVDQVYGMSFLLNALHLPFEIVLDNQLDQLNMYKVVVLPDVQCMDDHALQALQDYVTQGGILVAVGECGTKDPQGMNRTHGVLDNLFGIRQRYDNSDYCTLKPTVAALKSKGLPEEYMISGRARLLEVCEDVQVLAHGSLLVQTEKIANHDRQTVGDTHTSNVQQTKGSHYGVAICERTIGQGRAIYIAPSIGSDYSQNPNRRSREVFKRVLGEIDLPYTVEAPANVVVTGWRKDGKLLLHILNQPASMLHMTGLASALNPEDIAPTGPVRIDVPGQFTQIDSPYPELMFDVQQTEDHVRITIPVIHQHAVIALV
jgi:uncharacterized lipoprotein YddW (UPF0748 family)